MFFNFDIKPEAIDKGLFKDIESIKKNYGNYDIHMRIVGLIWI